MILAGAAVIGFLVGALIAVTSQGDSDVDGGASTATSGAPTPSTSTPVTPIDASLTLTADRERASTDELIRLEGVLRPAAPEKALQVQQSVDAIGFVDFPVTATTRSDGSYAVWVRTGRVGTNEFRTVTDVDGQRVVSNVIAVQVS